MIFSGIGGCSIFFIHVLYSFFLIIFFYSNTVLLLVFFFWHDILGNTIIISNRLTVFGCKKN